MQIRRAFTIIDSLIAIVCLATLLALVLLTASRTRTHMHTAGSLANLHQFAGITSSYHADNAGLFWSLNWSPTNHSISQFADLQPPYAEVFVSTAAQAVDLLRRRGGTVGAAIPRIPSWVPSILYSHLVLADYLDTSAFLRFAVSPGDRNLNLWSNDPIGFRNNAYSPIQPHGGDPLNARSVFASSYRIGPAFWSPDFQTATRDVVVSTGAHNTFMLSGPNLEIGRRTVSEVLHPSHKVHLFDSAQWRGRSTPIYWGYGFARIPMLFVDGSAHVRPTSQANPGFSPTNPSSTFSLTFSYQPMAWEPPIINSLTSITGRYYWTRNGIRGRDYDGLEVPAVP